MYPIGIDELNNLVYEGDVEPIVIRTTDRTNFKKCRRLWSYTSKLQRNLEPIKLNKNLAFGIAGHKGLEYYYNPVFYGRQIARDSCIAGFLGENQRQADQEHEASFYGLTDDRREEYAERAELGVGMLKGYFEWAQKEDEGWEPVATELKFQIPVPTSTTDNTPMVVDGRPVVYQVRLDMIAVKDDQLWIWDHKTAGNVTGDLGFLDLDTQLSSYILVLQGLLWSPISFIPDILKPYREAKVAGLQYNELAKTVPHPPKELAKGGLSKDKRQNTTYDLYVEALENMGLDRQPYADMLDYLQSKPETRFRRTPVTRSHNELTLQLEYIIGEARDMLNGPALYPNANKWNCDYCDFRMPSTVASEGGDVDFLLNDPTLFRVRPTEEEELDATTL